MGGPRGGDRLGRWGVERLADLGRLTAAALPDERLRLDDLQASCFDDGGVVLGTDDGRGVVAAVVRRGPFGAVGHIRLVVVDPDAQGHGLASRLLAEAGRWAFDEGAEEVRAGGEAPFALFPGVDVRLTPALCLFESAGYEPVGCELNLAMAVPVSKPFGPSAVEVTRALDDLAVEDVHAFCAARWPRWVAELERAVEHGSCLVAHEHGRVVGFACHSVNRAGWVGPMATDVEARGRGVGRALLGAVGRDLAAADLRTAEISCVGPIGFFVRSADAWVSRVFRTYRLPRSSQADQLAVDLA